MANHTVRKPYGKQITCHITKEFTGGFLVGLVTKEAKSFTSFEKAKKFVETGRKGVQAPFESPWKIIDATFKNLK